MVVPTIAAPNQRCHRRPHKKRDRHHKCDQSCLSWAKIETYIASFRAINLFRISKEAFLSPLLYMISTWWQIWNLSDWNPSWWLLLTLQKIDPSPRVIMGCGNCKASELSLIPTLSRELFRELLALHQSDTSHYYNSYDFACIKNTTRDGSSTML